MARGRGIELESIPVSRRDETRRPVTIQWTIRGGRKGGEAKKGKKRNGGREGTLFPLAWLGIDESSEVGPPSRVAPVFHARFNDWLEDARPICVSIARVIVSLHAVASCSSSSLSSWKRQSSAWRQMPARSGAAPPPLHRPNTITLLTGSESVKIPRVAEGP